jgi:methionyl-tRNA synthetase
MLMAAGVRLPDTIFLHGFFTVDGHKMSKTLGNKIDPNDMVEEFGADATRYLLLTQYPFGVDGDIQASRFVTQYNSDLANDLGNLVSRVAKLIATNFDGKLPESYDNLEGLSDLQHQAEGLADRAYAHVGEFRIGQALSETMNLVRAANKFFNDTAPWVLAKEGKTAELGGVLQACCEVLRIVSVLIYPVMPGKAEEIRTVLSLDKETLNLEDARRFKSLKAGSTVKLDQPVYPRLKPKKKPAPVEKAKPKEQAEAEEETNLLDIAEFAKAELRVAEVLSAEKVEGADKLLKLQVDTGGDKRQIVAGIAEHYAPEQMIGKKVVVVANLKPAKIRGVESRGMLLAAKKGKKLFVVAPDGDIPPGATVS